MNTNMIVVAHERPATVHALVTAFTAAGYEAAGALTLRDAIDLVSDCQPAMLVANLELGAFKGLHLAVRCANECPWMKIVVMGPADSALEREALRLGVAVYVSKSADPDVIVERALETMSVTEPAPLAPAAVTHA